MPTIAQKLGHQKNSIDYDFNTYRRQHNSFFANKEEEMNIRYQNLQDVLTVMLKSNIFHWLQGKTMLGIAKYSGLLPDDSDEDIGTDISNLDKVCQEVIPKLEDLGFTVIRATENNSMVTVMRKHRYIDICFFQEDGKGNYYYEQKVFPRNFYSSQLVFFRVNEFDYPVPDMYTEICRYSYNV